MNRQSCECQPGLCEYSQCSHPEHEPRPVGRYCKIAEHDALRAEVLADAKAIVELLATVPTCQKHKPLRFPACWQCRINATVEMNRQAMASEESGEGKA